MKCSNMLALEAGLLLQMNALSCHVCQLKHKMTDTVPDAGQKWALISPVALEFKNCPVPSCFGSSCLLVTTVAFCHSQSLPTPVCLTSVSRSHLHVFLDLPRFLFPGNFRLRPDRWHWMVVSSAGGQSNPIFFHISPGAWYVLCQTSVLLNVSRLRIILIAFW